ncbi:MAG: DUF1592 domain-containing protein [Pseudomonadota bacterium]
MKQNRWLTRRLNTLSRTISVLLGAGLYVTEAYAQANAASDVNWNLLNEYCSDCHNFEDQAGGVAFDIMDTSSLAADAEVWEHAIRKLSTGLMPPKGQPRPSHAELKNFVTQLETRLDTELAANPNPGNEGMSRLNRAEYSNVIRDLLAFDASSIIATLPADESEGGFDNMANVLSISPTLIEAYIGAAMRISREAVGDRSMIPTQVKYTAGSGAQTHHKEGLPLGTRGGMLVTHNFPLDAKYQIRVASGGGGFGASGFCSGPGIVLTLNGKALNPENPRDFQLEFRAGPQTLGVALVDDKRCEGVNEFYDVYSLSGSVQSIEIQGPFEAAGPGETPSRTAIFSCYPSSAAEESSCAREILTKLATSAYRHPLDAQAAEINSLMGFYEQGKQKGDFETGIQYALARLLIDPRFLYQAEEEPEGLAAGTVYHISDVELATRLAFFLWSSIPDQQLLDLAGEGRLSDPAILQTQVNRMLEDSRSHALVENFAGQWLRLRELDAALPQDPAFNASLREAFKTETELLFMDLIHDDRSVLHLLSTDYTYLNEELANHYGIEGVRGDYMRRVTLPEDSPRRGILGHGSILTATSVANRTSPVIRGEWIVENILGAEVPVPPPGVETDLTKDTAADGRVAHTLRERLEMHLVDPTCAACHQVMDPVGFALENFDLVGRWRESENGYPLNTTSQLVDGTPINNPVDMRLALLERGDAVATSMTAKLLSYALGRIVEPYDMPAVRKILHEAEADDYRFSDIVLGIVNSFPFQNKVATGAGANTQPIAQVSGTTKQ